MGGSSDEDVEGNSSEFGEGRGIALLEDEEESVPGQDWSSRLELGWARGESALMKAYRGCTSTHARHVGRRSCVCEGDGELGNG